MGNMIKLVEQRLQQDGSFYRRRPLRHNLCLGMTVGDKMTFNAGPYIQRFIGKYGKKPDLERVYKDRGRRIFLLTFCSILLILGTSWGIYRAFTIGLSNAELMILLVWLIAGFSAVCTLISILLVIRYGMREYERERIRTPDLLIKMTGRCILSTVKSSTESRDFQLDNVRRIADSKSRFCFILRKQNSSPGGWEPRENEEEAPQKNNKHTKDRLLGTILPDRMSAEEVKQYEKQSDDIAQLKKNIWKWIKRGVPKKEIIKLFPKDLGKAYPYAKNALQIIIGNGGLDDECREFGVYYDGNGKLIHGVRILDLRPVPNNRLWCGSP